MGPKPFRSQPTLSRTFPADRGAPGAARHALDDLGARIPPELRDDIRLLVSEIVTNSVIHGRSDAGAAVDLDVWTTGDSVRVSVTDHGPGFEPSPRRPRGDHSGWGLMMVDRLADRWGVDLDDGTEVWFEVGCGRDSAGVVDRRSGSFALL